ncbi:hypothetical protein EDC94DRAFT_510246 [Helicostylum pulchrum]|nr:hypothetical protein EDC94DRAFT_510246 [Helicostylum pulchrum]
MHLNSLIVSISLAASTVSAFNLLGLKSDIAIVHGNLTGVNNFAASYLAPFANDDATEVPYELIDDHEDLVQDRKGSIVSLRKRGDDCEKYHKISGDDNCFSLSLKYNVHMKSILEWNPQVNSKCTNMYTGKSYCVAKKTTTSRRHTKSSRTTKRVKTTTRKRTTKNSSDKRKLLQKNSALTYYWIAHPDDYDSDGKSIDVKTCDGKSLGTVPQSYADALVMEGTGIIGNKVINLGGCTCHDYKCFMEVDKKEDPYGLTSFGTPLRPFITIAANDIKRNTKIFVPEIEGWEIPGSSKKHNGCLLVDDRSWSFDSNHIDFYVYREKNYRTLNGDHKISKVDVYEGGDCNLLNYA